MSVAVPLVRPGAGQQDLLLRVGRVLLLTSLFLSSVLVARIGDYTAGDLALAACAACTGFATAVTSERGGDRMRALPTWQVAAAAAIVAGGALSGLRAQSAASTLAVVVRLILVVVVLPWLAKVLLRDRRGLRAGLTAFVAGCGATGAGTIVQFVFGEAVIPNTSVTDAGRFAGLTQNVSDTGGICCAGVVGGIALIATATSGRARVLPAVALVGSTFGLILSGSVSGLVSAAIGFALLGVTGVLRRRAIIGSVVAFGAVLAVSVAIQTASGALNPIQRILQTTGNSADDRYNTAGSRVSTYTEAFRKFTENPVIGNGLDPNSTIADGIYPAHNLFLASAYEGGVLLLIGVALAVLRPFWGLRAGRLRHDDPLLAIGVALVVTELTFAMTAPSLYNRYFWIPIALLLIARLVKETPEAPPNSEFTDVVAAPIDLAKEFARAGDPVRRRKRRHS